MKHSYFRPIYFIAMAWFGLFSSCNKKTHTSVAQSIKSSLPENQSLSAEKRIDSLAKQYLKTDYKVKYNTSRTVALIFRTLKNRPNSIYSTVSFLLYDLPADKILLRETVAQATVKWVDDSHLRVDVTPGIIQGGKAAGRGYLYDVNSQRKKALNQ
ncbi:MAG: hypothetical protein AAGA10_11265 [Bacteroidota bacterium]